MHCNRLRSLPISISIGAKMSRETLLGFYCGVDGSGDFSERFLTRGQEAKQRHKVSIF
jgi:hypothetical protein